MNSLQAERTQEESRMQVLEESLGRLLEDKLQNLKAVIRPNPDLVHGNIEKITVERPTHDIAKHDVVKRPATPQSAPIIPPAKPLAPLPPSVSVARDSGSSGALAATNGKEEKAPNRPETREAKAARKKRENDAKKKAEEDLLRAEVESDIERQGKRGYDFSRRLKDLYVPDKKISVTADDLYSAPRQYGGLRDLYVDKKAKLVVCTIEKVASSELKKLLHRMSGDPKWRDEPWFKGGLPKLKFEKPPPRGEEIMNSATWTKIIFLRHPYERLVSCFKDKFGRDNRLYSVKMTGNRSTHMLSFKEFVELISAPKSPHQNQHWRPQHTFCGLGKYLPLYNFVGNFEKLQAHAKIFLQATDIWDTFGADGWGPNHNGSMFERNVAMHRTSAGAVTGRLKIDARQAKQSYDTLLPPGSEIRKKAFKYYRKDFELFASINTPPFDAERYQRDLEVETAAGPPLEPWPRRIHPYNPIVEKRRRRLRRQ